MQSDISKERELCARVVESLAASYTDRGYEHRVGYHDALREAAAELRDGGNVLFRDRALASVGEPAAWRTSIFEQLPNGKLTRLILDVSEVTTEPGADWTPLYASPVSAGVSVTDEDGITDAMVERAARVLAGEFLEHAFEGDAESEWWRIADITRRALEAAPIRSALSPSPSSEGLSRAGEPTRDAVLEEAARIATGEKCLSCGFVGDVVVRMQGDNPCCASPNVDCATTEEVQAAIRALASPPPAVTEGVSIGQVKKIAVTFFRWWWNQPGTNTDQGFDEWAETPEARAMLSAAPRVEGTVGEASR